MRGVLPGRPDMVPEQRPSSDPRVGAQLQPRVEPTPAWVAKAKAQQAAGEEVTPPADDEQDMVVGIRALYLVPSDLVPEKEWPVVGTDLEVVLCRVSMADLKQRVHAAMVAKGHPLAAKVVPQRSGAA